MTLIFKTCVIFSMNICVFLGQGRCNLHAEVPTDFSRAAWVPVWLCSPWLCPERTTEGWFYHRQQTAQEQRLPETSGRGQRSTITDNHTKGMGLGFILVSQSWGKHPTDVFKCSFWVLFPSWNVCRRSIRRRTGECWVSCCSRRNAIAAQSTSWTQRNANMWTTWTKATTSPTSWSRREKGEVVKEDHRPCSEVEGAKQMIEEDN